MTDPASAIQREVDQLIDSQIAALRGSNFTDLDWIEYRDRAERIGNLFSALDRIEGDKVPKWHPRLRARNRKSVAGRD